jgi:hypothetical protein
MGGLINIGLGIVFIIGGLTGNMALRGTQSGVALAVVGAILLIFGIVRLKGTRG